MLVQLVIVEGPKDLGRTIKLVNGPSICGRLPTSAIVLASEKVSKKHCQFEIVSGVIFVKDLGSSNGIFINGDRLPEAKLKRGDRIQIGDYVLEITGQGE